MNEILSILFLISGLIAIFIGTTGIFGYSFLRVITRKQAIAILFTGLFSLIIAGRFNLQILPEINSQQSPMVPQVNQSSSTTTLFQNNSTQSTQQTNNTSNTKIDVDVSIEELNYLVINDDFSSIPSYDRDIYFGSWIDEDGDCQNTRAEVLLIESLSSVSFRDNNSCTVDSGEWYDPYTNSTFYFASDVDIDHFVPLYDAFYSGAYLWPEHKRVEYSNDIYVFEHHLIAVDKGENRTKGKKPPHEWMPPNSNYHCEYAANWITIKYLWELTITTQEYNFLQNQIQNC